MAAPTHYRIKDWKTFQRYKDRRPPWIKLYRSLLDDPDIMTLPDDVFRMLVCLWLVASEFEDGDIPIDAPAWRIRMDPNGAASLIAQLVHTGLVQEVTL